QLNALGAALRDPKAILAAKVAQRLAADVPARQFARPVALEIGLLLDDPRRPTLHQLRYLHLGIVCWYTNLDGTVRVHHKSGAASLAAIDDVLDPACAIRDLP